MCNVSHLHHLQFHSIRCLRCNCCYLRLLLSQSPMFPGRSQGTQRHQLVSQGWRHVRQGGGSDAFWRPVAPHCVTMAHKGIISNQWLEAASDSTLSYLEAYKPNFPISVFYVSHVFHLNSAKGCFLWPTQPVGKEGFSDLVTSPSALSPHFLIAGLLQT